MSRLRDFGRIPRLPARPFDRQTLRSMTPRTAAAVAMGGLSMLLGTMVVALTLQGRHAMQTLARQTDQVTPPATAMPNQKEQPPQPTWPRRETLRASLSRPPFYPDRKLPAEEAPAAGGGDERYRLAGTVVSGQRRFAIIENRTTKETKRLGRGETLDGLPILEVLPDRVILGQGMQRRELHLTWAPSPKSPPRRTAIAEPDKRAGKPKPEQANNTAAQRPSPNRGVKR